MDTPLLTDFCTRHRSLRATQSICHLAVGTDLHFNSPCKFIPVEVRPAVPADTASADTQAN